MVETQKKDSFSLIKKIGEYCINMSEPHLGRGSFSKVWKAYLQNDPSKCFALKQIETSAFPQEDYDSLMDLVNREVEIMSSISHPNIVELFGGIHTPNNFYFVLEFCKDGNLKARKKSISVENTLICVKKIAEAMVFFNTNGIIHRDIKPENILLHNGEIKIADMGFARKMEDSQIGSLKLTKAIGTPYYMAPEIYYGEDYDSRCDVWSLGVMFYELIFKKLPWNGESQKGLFDNIKAKKLKFPSNEKVDSEIKDLIGLMLTKKKENRPNFKKVLKHNVFREKLPEKVLF